MTREFHMLLLLLAQGSVPREVIQLAQIKHEMTALLNKMPDFVCQEAIERSAMARGTKQFKVNDSLRLDVAFVGGREIYGKQGTGTLERSDPAHFAPHGVSSTGEFVGHARSVFVDGGATMKYVGAGDLQGRLTLRWNYVLSSLASGWTLTYAGRSARVASQGSFWVDPQTLDLLQLDIDAMEIQPHFPISAAHLSINYGKAQLGSRLALIPQRSELVLTEAAGKSERNIVQFSRCRQYGTESAISFDAEPAPPVKK